METYLTDNFKLSLENRVSWDHIDDGTTWIDKKYRFTIQGYKIAT